MATLPDHIGKYLSEAGFSHTETLVLNRLLDGETQTTLRELAARTGKSTGVLDQAVKKLIQKKILIKRSVNGTPKYILESYAAIQRWARRDMKQRWETMHRKEQDFESFLSSIQSEKGAPVIEHYEGMDGMKKAYSQLLATGDELLQYFPFSSTSDQDRNPLKDFRSAFIKARRKAGVFSRVIAYDSPLGRKYHSRDHFEFRRTVLIPEKEYSISFEKLIAGDIVGCFNCKKNKAYIIRFPELASSERHTFELIWSMMSARQATSDCSPVNRKSSLPQLTAVSRNKFKAVYAGLVALLPARVKEVMKLCGFIPRTLASSNKKALSINIEIVMKDRPALVYDISRPFALRNMHIARFVFFAVPENLLLDMSFEARDFEEMSYVIDELQRVPGVMNIRRKTMKNGATEKDVQDILEPTLI